MRNHSHSPPSFRSRRSSALSEGQHKLANNWHTESRDDELALFQHVRHQECTDFLHPSNDDIEVALSIDGGGLTGLHSPISSATPPCEDNDLLQTDLEKNDYNWLLTPPGTPLFPSLDKDMHLSQLKFHTLETSSLSNITRLSNGRDINRRMSQRSPSLHFIDSSSSFSNANNMKKKSAYSPSRRPPSPQRPSMSSQAVGRASTSSSRTSTRSSPPPSLTRINTCPTVQSSSTKRSTLKDRFPGTSVPLKLKVSQQPHPSNLRTSVSTTSRNSNNNLEARHSCSQMVDVSRRKSCSSSFSGRIPASLNNQDHWSSKDSLVSSSDNGIDVIQPSFIDYSPANSNSTLGDTDMVLYNVRGRKCLSSAKRSVGLAALSRETNRLPSINAKKSLEVLMGEVDHRQVPQSIFWHGLSNASAQLFCNTQHRSISLLLQSSITASSDASSEHGVKIFPGEESSDEEIKSDWYNLTYGATPKESRGVSDHCDVSHGCIDGENGFLHQFEQAGVVHSFPIPIGSVHLSACQNFSTDTPEFQEWNLQDSPKHNTQNTSKAGSCSFKIESPKSHGSAEQNSNGTDYQQDGISIHSQEARDSIVVDIQDDHTLQSTISPWAKTDSQELQNIHRKTCTCDKENICMAENWTSTEPTQEEQAIADIPKWENQVAQARKLELSMCRQQQPPCGTFSDLKSEMQSNMRDATSSGMGKPSIPCNMEFDICSDPKSEKQSSARDGISLRMAEPSLSNKVTDAVTFSKQTTLSMNEFCSNEKTLWMCAPSIVRSEIISLQDASASMPIPHFRKDFTLKDEKEQMDLNGSPSYQKSACQQSLKFHPSTFYYGNWTDKLEQSPQEQNEVSLEMNDKRGDIYSSEDDTAKLHIAPEESFEDNTSVKKSRGHMFNEAINNVLTCQIDPSSGIDGDDIAIKSPDMILAGKSDYPEVPASAKECICKQPLLACKDLKEFRDVTGTCLAAYIDTVIDKPDEMGKCFKDYASQCGNLELESTLGEDYLRGVSKNREEYHRSCITQLDAPELKETMWLGMHEHSLEETTTEIVKLCYEETQHDSEDTPRKLDVQAGHKHISQSFSLEETTSTILFCSSIVYDIIYKAAATASEKEQSVFEAVVPKPKSPFWKSGYKSPLKVKMPFPQEPHSEVVCSVQPDRPVTNKTIYMQPPITECMKTDEVKTTSNDNNKEKSCLIFTSANNCHCTIM